MNKIYLVMYHNLEEEDYNYWGVYTSLENAMKSIPEHCNDALNDHDRMWIESCELDGTKCCVEVGSKSVKEWEKEFVR
jgi:hypothetical protein